MHACLLCLIYFLLFIFFPLAFHRKPSGNTNSPSWRVHQMTARHEWSSCSRIQRINRSKWRSECVYMRILGWNVKSTIMLYKQRIFFGFTILVWLFWCQIYHSFDKIVKGDDIFNPVNPDIWNNRNYYNCFFFGLRGYLIHQPFLAHIVWYSENMKEKTARFYSETQTEQKYAIWCRGWYLYEQKVTNQEIFKIKIFF